jgi:phosphohistidine phosphatase
VHVFLVHHADAVHSDVDPQRPLSARGRAQAAAVARDAAARGARPEAVWHSGKLRARQTAEACWRATNPLADLAVARGLQPTDPCQWMRDQLAAETRDIMCVGHMPNIARLAALLTTGDENAVVGFPAHGLVALERGADEWKEVWRLAPPL